MIPSQRVRSFGVLVATLILATSGSALAGDCRDVKFSFKNNIPAKIRVVAVRIEGNDGSWRENVANAVILPTYSHVTGGRRLNRLDSGASPRKMSVEFEEHIPQTQNGWRNRAFRHFTGLPSCVDGITYQFEMNPAP